MTLTSQNSVVVTILALVLGFAVGAFIIIFTTATILGLSWFLQQLGRARSRA